MSTSIILIGPPRAGKSSIGKLLAERLGKRPVAMDSVRFEYYREIGYDQALAAQLQRTGGFWSLYRYWKPFEVHSVERVVAEHSDAVIDLGAGHSVHEDSAALERVRRALRSVPYVILLLPSPNLAESLEILRQRDPSFEDLAPGLSELCLSHPSNRLLATHVFYTGGKTPYETCHEICNLLLSPGTLDRAEQV